MNGEKQKQKEVEMKGRRAFEKGIEKLGDIPVIHRDIVEIARDRLNGIPRNVVASLIDRIKFPVYLNERITGHIVYNVISYLTGAQTVMRMQEGRLQNSLDSGDIDKSDGSNYAIIAEQLDQFSNAISRINDVITELNRTFQREENNAE